MNRRFGIEPALATAQAQHPQEDGRHLAPFQALPQPTGHPPYRLALSDVIAREPLDSLCFCVIGDSGGVVDPHPQSYVADALGRICTPLSRTLESPVLSPSFIYSVGDVAYFNGAEAAYTPQFYEAYAHVNVPFLAIPGNHDGDPEPGETSLQGFMHHFCDIEPRLLPEVEEFNRDTMTQPNCYWTLTDERVTIIGLYSNVPSGGRIERDQYAWLVAELKAAPQDRPLLISLHHPPYSCDTHHGGSAEMGVLLDEAFVEAQRDPDLVLSGHVHNYQRFLRELGGKRVPYLVVGNGGYHNLHAVASDAHQGMQVTSDTTLEAFDDKHWGYLQLTLDAHTIRGSYVCVEPGQTPWQADSFTITLG